MEVCAFCNIYCKKNDLLLILYVLISKNILNIRKEGNNMPYINLAEAKFQITRISEFVDAPLFLVGGLAVNQYVKTRNSRDIDLICSDNTAKQIINNLYPSNDWNYSDENDDDYKPSFVITHKIKTDYPVIKFGPKIIERGMYKYINFDDCNDSQAFKYKNISYENIRVPSIEFLCYMKIVSFLGRDISKNEKILKDLKDIEDLCNNDSFKLGIFLNLIRKNKLEDIIHKEFPQRLSLINEEIDFCNFGIITKMFYNCINIKHEVEISNNKRFLVAFDLDGTLIKGIRYSWTLLWEKLNVGNSNQKQRKNDFKNGKLSYIEWTKLDCEDLIKHKLSQSIIADIAKSSNCQLTKNLVEAIEYLKKNDAVVVIISGGIDALLYELLPDANEIFDEILINKFIFDENGYLKSISPTEYDWDDSKKGVVGKNRGLEKLCEKYSIPIENSVFIGDDLNDIKAMEIAGKKIYYCTDKREFQQDGLPKGISLIHTDNLMEVAYEIIDNNCEEIL